MTKADRRETITALIWSAIESVGHRALTLFITIILARLLTPADFGLMGMLAILVAVATLAVEGGMTGAIIQKKDLTERDKDTAFIVNLAVSFIILTLLIVAAPYIAVFYGEPQLELMTIVLSSMFVVHGFAAVQVAQMTRQLKFKLLTVSSWGALVVSGSVAITLAASGFGVWSLVAQQITFGAIRTSILWAVHPWRPSLRFHVDSFNALFSYGHKILAAEAINRFCNNLYLVVIGKSYGTAPLGLYTRAKILQEFPATTLANIVGRVVFPVFSRSQDDPSQLKNGMKQAITKIVVLNFPMLAGVAVLAEPIVTTLLGQQWEPAAPFLRLLCVVGLVFPANLVNINLLKAIGRADLVLILEISRQLLVLVNIAITWRISIEAMISGHIVLSATSWFIYGHFSNKLTDYGFWEQIKDVAPYAAATIAMAIAVYAAHAGGLRMLAPIVELAALVPLGFVLYVAICFSFRLEAFMDVLTELRKKV